jgi:glycerol-3-phosphate acyltransferase PlsX
VAHAIGHWLKQEFTSSPVRLLAALLLRGAMKKMKSRMDPELHGGAPLLGVNGIVIITHGASSATAIYNAVRVAGEAIGHQLNRKIHDGIVKLSKAD